MYPAWQAQRATSREQLCTSGCTCQSVWLPAHLQAHFAKYEPTILELKRKYELAMKEKMLAGLDRDKMAAKVSTPARVPPHA